MSTNKKEPIIEELLLEYLDSLSMDELKQTTRKQCRLHLETLLHQNLDHYKQHIKNMLVSHVIALKQRAISKEKPEKDVHQVQLANIHINDNKQLHSNTDQQMSAVHAQHVSPNHDIGGDKQRLHSPLQSQSTRKRRTSYQHDDEMPSPKKRKLSMSTSSAANENDNTSVQLQPSTNVSIEDGTSDTLGNDGNNDLHEPVNDAVERDSTVVAEVTLMDIEKNALVKQHMNALHDLEIQHRKKMNELLEKHRANIEKNEIKFCHSICDAKGSEAETRKIGKNRLEHIDKKYKKRLNKLMKEHNANKKTLQTSFRQQIEAQVQSVDDQIHELTPNPDSMERSPSIMSL